MRIKTFHIYCWKTQNKHPEKPWLIVERLYSALNLPLITSHVHNLVCLTTKFSIFIKSCWGSYNVLSNVTKYQWNPYSFSLFLAQTLISDFCHPTCADRWHRGSQYPWLGTHRHAWSDILCSGETQFCNQDWWPSLTSTESWKNITAAVIYENKPAMEQLRKPLHHCAIQQWNRNSRPLL